VEHKTDKQRYADREENKVDGKGGKERERVREDTGSEWDTQTDTQHLTSTENK